MSTYSRFMVLIPFPKSKIQNDTKDNSKSDKKGHGSHSKLFQVPTQPKPEDSLLASSFSQPTLPSQIEGEVQLQTPIAASESAIGLVNHEDGDNSSETNKPQPKSGVHHDHGPNDPVPESSGNPEKKTISESSGNSVTEKNQFFVGAAEASSETSGSEGDVTNELEESRNVTQEVCETNGSDKSSESTGPRSNKSQAQMTNANMSDSASSTPTIIENDEPEDNASNDDHSEDFVWPEESFEEVSGKTQYAKFFVYYI